MSVNLPTLNKYKIQYKKYNIRVRRLPAPVDKLGLAMGGAAPGYRHVQGDVISTQTRKFRFGIFPGSFAANLSEIYPLSPIIDQHVRASNDDRVFSGGNLSHVHC